MRALSISGDNFYGCKRQKQCCLFEKPQSEVKRKTGEKLPSSAFNLFNRYRFCKVTRLIYIAAPHFGGIISQ